MKKTLIALALICAWPTVQADTWVNGYTRNNGTYVQGHYRSSPNNTTLDNYSTKGNYNPYTGERGTRSPYGGDIYGGHSGKNDSPWPYSTPYRNR